MSLKMVPQVLMASFQVYVAHKISTTTNPTKDDALKEDPLEILFVCVKDNTNASLRLCKHVVNLFKKDRVNVFSINMHNNYTCKNCQKLIHKD